MAGEFRPRSAIPSSAWKTTTFAVVTMALLGLLATLIGNISFESSTEYSGRFTDATGVLKGDRVRLSGVEVGSVRDVRIIDAGDGRMHALVRFSVRDDVPVLSSAHLQLRYENIVGTVIASALDSVPEGLRVLEDERPRLVSTLEELGKLSDTASPLLQDTKADTIADFKHLTRILENLAASKERLATALLNIGTFPFPSYTKYVTKFDYAGMYGLYALDLDSFNNLLAQQAASTPAATKGAAVASPGVTPTGSPTPALPLGLKVPDITVPEVPIVSDLALPNRVVNQLVKNLSPVVGGQP